MITVTSTGRVDLPIAPSTYYAYKVRQADPLARARRDRVLRGHIRRIWQDNHGVYGARKVWSALVREGIVVARRTVERLMRQMGLAGVTRVRAWTTTTHADCGAGRPADLVDRGFTVAAPGPVVGCRLHLRRDVARVRVRRVRHRCLRRRIVGWRVSTHQRTDFVLDALEQAIWDRTADRARRPRASLGCRVAILSIRYGARLVDASINPSVGSVGDSYDNSLAETIIGLYKTEVIRRRGPWRSVDDVEFATLEWVHWFNTIRLYGPPRVHPTGRARSQLLRCTRTAGAARTHLTELPSNPVRFIPRQSSRTQVPATVRLPPGCGCAQGLRPTPAYAVDISG